MDVVDLHDVELLSRAGACEYDLIVGHAQELEIGCVITVDVAVVIGQIEFVCLAVHVDYPDAFFGHDSVADAVIIRIVQDVADVRYPRIVFDVLKIGDYAAVQIDVADLVFHHECIEHETELAVAEIEEAVHVQDLVRYEGIFDPYVGYFTVRRSEQDMVIVAFVIEELIVLDRITICRPEQARSTVIRVITAVGSNVFD